jgi:Rieske Fe-S protein
MRVMTESSQDNNTVENDVPERRGFMATVAMLTGLFSGYGMFASMAGRYLFPSHTSDKSWLFVKDLGSFGEGESLTYHSPAGQSIVITRLGKKGEVGDFIALSSVCPHLGCQVHWEGQNNRFFCPCHNGAFSAEGQPTEGPPKVANQTLAQYELQVENGLLYIEVSTQSLV